MNITRTFVGLFIALVSNGQAYAAGAVPAPSTFSAAWSDARGQGQTVHEGFPSRVEICRVGGGVVLANYKEGHPNTVPAITAVPGVNAGGNCEVNDSNWGGLGGFLISETPGACPAGTTGPSGAPPVCTCAADAEPNSAGSACVPQGLCQKNAGKQGTQALTIGWSRRPPTGMSADSYRDMVGPLSQPAPGSASCVQGCSATMGSVVSASSSATPTAQGTYRLSGVYVYTVDPSPKSCASDPNDANSPVASPRACDGYAGTVGGVPTCVAPIGAAPVSAPPPQPPTFGNPAAGSDGALPIGDPAVSPPRGDGGPGGGPPTPKDGTVGSAPGSAAGSASGAGGTQTSGGTGTPTDPYRPKDPCGLPGTPPCKFDETGTGNGVGALDGAKNKFDAEAAKQNGLITSAGSSVTKLPWVFSFTLPTGGCTVFHWGRRGEYVVDPCSSPWIAIFRNLMAYMFFGLAGFYMWKSTVGYGPGGK